MARKSDFTLPPIPVDAIFSTQAERDDALLERVHNIPLEELHPFKDHPFKIQSGEEMDKMVESIRKVGAITPALARPLADGGDPTSVEFCHTLGLDYVSCSPFRVPIARLAAAQAAIKESK